MAGILSIAAPLVGMGGSLFNMFGGGGKSNASNVQAPPMWQAPGMTDTANNVLGAIPGQGQYNTYGQMLPQAGQTTQGLYNNPYAQFMQGGAGGAAGMGMTGAMNSFQQGSSLYPYAQSVMQTGFDPQQALYDRTAQQVSQQARAGQAARGILTSPYGAGLENKAMSDFNIDWQNQQLQRQLAGGQGMGSLAGQGANLIGGGQQMISAAPVGPLPFIFS